MDVFGFRTVFVISFVTLFSIIHVNCNEIGGSCLPGNKHKAKPSPEGPEYKACLIFKESSCCTANFTNQLAKPVIRNIGNFNWTLCGTLSKKCQDFMVGVECFYSCSPYVAHWGDKDEIQAFNDAPVCTHYCDDWFEACKDDKTCAKNWIKGFDWASGGNRCKPGSSCKTFKDTFVNGEGLCQNMWDDSFKYTEPGSPCLHFNFSGPHNPNKEAVVKIFGGTPARQASLFLAVVTLAVTVLIFV